MCEWLDNQNLSISSIRQLLQQLIEKANPRRNLAVDEAKRFSNLEEIANKLRRGENVQNRQLQTWLREDENAQIEASGTNSLCCVRHLRTSQMNLSGMKKSFEDVIIQFVAEGM